METRGARFERDGFLVIDGLVDPAWCAAAIELCEPLLVQDRGRKPGARGVLQRQPRLCSLIADSAVPALVEEIAGPGAGAVRSIMFDKSPESNWSVPWHQDAVIAVRERVEVPGFGPWSVKGGEPHCRPPLEVMNSVVVVRIHLDDCGPQNGPLRLVPRSHAMGILLEREAERVGVIGPQVECCVAAGGAVVMRPHTVHSSPRSVAESRRRVLHLEYSAARLPGGLQWAEGLGSERTVLPHG